MPADTGGHLRSLNILKGLDAAFDVTVLALEREGADLAAFRDAVRGRVVVCKRDPMVGAGGIAEAQALLRGEPLLYSRWAGPTLAAELERQLQNHEFGVVHFDHVHTSQLMPLVRRLAPRAKIVIDEHNVEALIVERVASLSPLPKRLALGWHARRLYRMESRLVQGADAVLACSSIDAQALERLGARRVEVVPNGVDFKGFAVEPGAERRNVVFVGSCDWWPNADAALTLVRQIWPLAEPRLPGAKLQIVGRNPSAELLALSKGSVQVKGGVPSVLPFLKDAFATAIPLRAGSGTRLKIIEAAAAKVPIVCSRLAAEGLPMVNEKHLLFAENPAEYEAALARLWNDRALAARLADAAYEMAASLDWGRVGASLAAFYRDWSSASDQPQRGETVA